jgi:hypothetical protein
MKIRQNVRHWASKQALTMPVVGDVVEGRLVDMHTDIFLERATEDEREARREHLHDFFDVTMDTYVAALDASHSEADAREITHIQANFDFYNHGWTEMMEFPAAELGAHYDRYQDFFETHNISVADPLGNFRPADNIADAPSTPAKLAEPEHPYAEGGFADDVYVEGQDGEVRVGGQEEPADIDPESVLDIDPDEESGDKSGTAD